MVDRWQVDPRNLCGILTADAEGAFSVKAIKPTKYKVCIGLGLGCLEEPENGLFGRLP